MADTHQIAINKYDIGSLLFIFTKWITRISKRYLDL